MEKELVNDKLLKKDVKSLVEKVKPFLPYLGILSGGDTVGKHVVKDKTKDFKTEDDKFEKHDKETAESEK